LVLLNLATEPITYKNFNKPICVIWSPQQILALGLDLKRHVEALTDKNEKLMVYIKGLINIDDINKVTFDMTILS